MGTVGFRGRGRSKGMGTVGFRGMGIAVLS